MQIKTFGLYSYWWLFVCLRPLANPMRVCIFTSASVKGVAKFHRNKHKIAENHSPFSGEIVWRQSSIRLALKISNNGRHEATRSLSSDRRWCLLCMKWRLSLKIKGSYNSNKLTADYHLSLKSLVFALQTSFAFWLKKNWAVFNCSKLWLT